MRKAAISILMMLFCYITNGQSRHSKTSAFKSYKGLVMAGYQGWFNTPDDGAGRGWNHYNGHHGFEPGSIKVDLWPDVSEYEKTYQTPFKKRDGTPAYVFSSYNASTVDLHFKWMQQYGIDGVFIQRFVTNVKNKVGLNANDGVLHHALKSSQKYRRVIAVMYDLSGMSDDDDQTVIRDWKHLVDDLKLTGGGNRQTYLYHNGKPLVALWGIGFSDHRAYHLPCIERIINFLKNDPVYGGCAILLGVPAYWRDFGPDTEHDPYLHDVIRQADIVHPWFVGRYSETDYPQFKIHIQQDMRWCAENHLDYVPTVFPGFSWHNMYPDSPQDQIPRHHGNFFWEQLSGDLSIGAKMLYVAMFDEIDEGTAIFKIDKDPPAGVSSFVTFEPDVAPDYYLFLTGMAGKILKKQVPLTFRVPLLIQK